MTAENGVSGDDLVGLDRSFNEAAADDRGKPHQVYEASNGVDELQ